MEQIYFFIFAAIAVICGAGIFFGRHPIAGAVNLVGVMLSLAGIYGLLAGPFLGIIQILVYAGAIMMLVVFVIMVLNSALDSNPKGSGWLGLVGLVLPIGLCVIVCMVLSANIETPVAGDEMVATPSGSIQQADKNQDGEIDAADIGAELFNFAPAGKGYYILFEVIGLVLLVALTGAVLLAKRGLGSPEETLPQGGQH